MTIKPKSKGGRPTIYNDKLGEEICDKVSTTTKGLPTLCQMYDHWPAYETIYAWIRTDGHRFSHIYAKAKEDQDDYLCDDILRIIDKPETFEENGVERNDVGMCRLKVDSLKWQAMKLKPKKWGEKAYEDLKQDNERVKAELEELRAKLDSQNRKEY